MKNRGAGLLLSLVFAVFSIQLGRLFPLLGSSVFAIILGILLNHFWNIPQRFRPGLNFSAKKNLQYAIVLLGFSLSFSQVSETGVSSLKISLLTILVAFLTAYLSGKWLKLSKNLTFLIGFGTAICGGSAIAAASPILDADEEEVALSISTIFFFNILAVFVFPFLGHLMQMSDITFGTWAGTAINDTSSVVAAGYTYSQTAGDLATIVKLSRALMIVPSCLLFALYRYKKERKQAQKVTLRTIFPWFILWFILASLVVSLGFLPSAIPTYTKLLSQWLMAMALFSIGSKVSFKQFKEAGTGPLLTGLLSWFAVAVSSLLIQYFL